jgi:hypothetical protein
LRCYRTTWMEIKPSTPACRRRAKNPQLESAWFVIMHQTIRVKKQEELIEKYLTRWRRQINKR